MAFNSRVDSRFAISTPILTRDGKATYGIAKKYRFMDKSLGVEAVILVVDQSLAARPDRIAQKLYGNADLHWIVTQFNRAENPFGWPKVGQILECPSRRAVSAEL